MNNATKVGDRVRICVNGTATAPAFVQEKPRTVSWVHPQGTKIRCEGHFARFATSWVKVRGRSRPQSTIVPRNGGGMDPPEVE